MTFDRPVAADTITVQVAPGDAHPTAIGLSVDGRRIEAHLDERAWSPGGQAVELPAGTATTVAVEILAVDRPGVVGFSEIDVGAATVEETLRLPTALVDQLGPDDGPRPVHYVLTRDRGDVEDPARAPTEVRIDRLVEVGRAATFRVSGTASGGTTNGSCDDELVTIDGSPVPVRVEAAAGRSGTVTACTTVSLAPGSHHVQVHAAGAIDLDQLVLSTGPERTAPPGRDLTLNVTAEGRRHVAGTIAATDRRFWLVLSQSENDGWHLSVDGATVVDRSMVDGYANGWLIQPRGGPVTISLRWTPQRIVWAGMGISAATMALALLVLLRGRRSSVHLRFVLGDAPEPGRPSRSPVLIGLGALGLATVGWFVADPEVAAIAVLALVVRIIDRRARILLAGAATAAVVGALVTSRPSLVFVALGCVAAELLGERLQPLPETSNDAG